MSKIKLWNVVKYFVYPHHLYKVIRLQKNRKKVERTYNDAQLKLYSRILPGDFLHYGYFDNPQIAPEDISLNDIYNAQLKYAENLVNLATDKGSPVLDVGCGMGGLIELLKSKGFSPVALTPDKTQIHHIRTKYKGTEVIEGKFEDIPVSPNTARFGTVITSESLQYLKLDQALPLIDKVLKAGGKWVACDYFRTGDKAEKSGHYWSDFEEKLKQNGWKVTYKQDITPNILPTISYVHMWATKIGLPLKEFAISKLKTKNPGIHYALEDSLEVIEKKIDKNIETVTPSLFAANKRYLLLVMERR